MFDLSGKTALITGGCGLLGMKHAEAILEFGGEVILTDLITGKDGNKHVDIYQIIRINKLINKF